MRKKICFTFRNLWGGWTLNIMDIRFFEVYWCFTDATNILEITILNFEFKFTWV